MPIDRSHLPVWERAGALALGIVLTGVLAAPVAASTPARLHVVTGDGKSLVSARVHTGPTRVPTHPRADCFFGGAGGSGTPVSMGSPNALGLVADAARRLPRLRPLLVTDEFSFGLGVCGIGGARGDASRFWSVRVNHRALQVGGDQYRVRPGDRVLWALIDNPVCGGPPDFACKPGPPELALRAPVRARPGQPFRVRVLKWSDSGLRTAAEGVRVTGASGLTDASGFTQVTLARTRKLKASRAGSISSPPATVCVRALARLCSRVRGLVIAGSDRGEAMRGTYGPDRIKPGGGRDLVLARGGADLIRVRGGGRDRVNCGGGRDLVLADRGDRVAGNCERVRRA